MVTSLFNQTPPARDMGYCVVEALRKKLVFTDGVTTVTIGVIPAGGLIISGGVFVATAFNGTTPTINIGHADLPTADPDAYATAVALGALGYIALDELAAVTNTRPNVERTVTATMALSGATAGEAEVVVLFVNNHEGGR